MITNSLVKLFKEKIDLIIIQIEVINDSTISVINTGLSININLFILIYIYYSLNDIYYLTNNIKVIIIIFLYL